MNKNHRIIWNDVRGCFVVASEKTKSRGKPSTTRKTTIAAAVAALLLAPGMAAAVCSGLNPVTGTDHLTETQCYTDATAVIQSGGSIIDSQLTRALGIEATNTSLSNAGLVRANVAPVGLDSPNAVDALAIRFVDDLAGSLSNTGTIEALVTDHYANNVYATGVMIGGVDEYSFVGRDLSGSLTNSNTISVVASSDMSGEEAGTSPRVYAAGIIAGNLTEDGVLSNNEGHSIYVSASATGEDAEAYAAGISLAGTSSYDSYASTYVYTGGNLAGSLTNSGTITAVASAMATAGEDVDATASASGIYVGGELSGSLDNKGTITATATATADGTYTAAAGEDASSAVYADVDAYAVAYGVAAGSLSAGASLTNEGTITAAATATADGTYTATAAGEDAYSAAYGDVDAYAGAYGVVAGSLSAGASFTNEGTITAAATATAGGTYTAGEDAYSSAYSLAYGDVDARARAYGVTAGSLDAGASFTNEGTITATATATADGTYAATAAGEDAYSAAYGEVDAYAVAYGVAAGSLGEDANFINKDTITATATATADGTYTATAAGEDAYSAAYGEVGAYAVAYGVAVGSLGEDANFINKDTITATSTSTAGGTYTATAAGEDAYSAAYGDVYAYAGAYGVATGSLSAGASFTNEGTITAAATATAEGAYTAGEDAYSSAYSLAYGDVDARARTYGVTAGSLDAGASFTNEGTITATATATAGGTYTATAAGEDAYSLAYGDVEARARTYGVAVGSLGEDANFINKDTITATSTAGGTYAATAAGEDAYSAAYGDVDAYAVAYGVATGSLSAGASFTNEGTITAAATATAGGTYTATAAGEDAYSAAYGDVDAYAVAYGVATGSLSAGASFTNEGTITATATATAEGTYTAGEGAYSLAYGDVDAYARAYGVTVGSLDAGASFTNEGTITATATATAEGTYTAGEDAYSLAYGEVDAYARAYGVTVDSLGAGASFTNEGTITAAATATAEGTYIAGEDAYSLAYGDVDAYARAEGVAIGSLGAGASFINKGTGVIEATATANGSDYAYAAAYGVRIGYLGEGASLTNDGKITATATANDVARAYGVYVGEADLGGLLTNTGTITATATANGEDAYAYGVYVDGELNGTLTNSGMIEGIADDPANGYSLYVDGGVPHSIHNEAGGVLKGNLYVGGDVAVYNAGLISIPAGAHGEIEGNYTQQTGGVLEIGVTDGYAPDGEGGYDHASGDNGGSMYASLDVGGTADLSASSTIAVRVKPVNSLDKGDKLNNVLNAPSGEDGLLLASGSAAEGDTVKVIGTPLFTYRGVVDAHNNVDIYIDDARTFAETLGSQGNPSIAGIGSTLDGLHDDYVDGMNGEDHNPGPMGDLIDALYGLNSVDELNRAAQSLTPLIASDMGQATQGVMRDMNRIIQARQDGNRGLSSGEQFYGDRNFWFKPFGSRADQKQRGGVPGYRAKSYGMAFGADAVISNATRIGAAFTYANSDVDTKSTLRQWGDVDSYQLAFYGSHSLDEKTDVNFQVDFGHHKNDVGRNVLVPTPTVAKGSFNAWSSHIGAGVGRVYALSEKTSLTPSVRADYSYLRTKGYTESGAGLVSLMVDGFKVDELILSADGKLNHDLGGGASFIANLGLGYDALGDRTSITSSFVGGGAAFATQGIDPSKWLVRGGLGLVMKKDKSFEITARYDVEGRSNFTNQTASVKIRIPF